RNIGDPQQPLPDVLDVVAQLALREPVGNETVDDPEGIAELIVEARPYHARRQGVAHVAHALAYVIPGIRHFAGRRAALEVDEDGRAAWAREAAQEIEVRGFLEGLLDAVRHLIERLLEGGAGPASLHDHGAEGERRILVAAEAGIEQCPC